MFEKFSEEAIKVILLAQEEARILKHPAVGCEHLLLGLMACGTGIAHKVLSLHNLTLAGLRENVETVHKKGKKVSPKELPFDTDAKGALERAFEEVRKSNDAQICSEHLLLGLLFSPWKQNLATSLFSTLGIDPQGVRLSVIYLMQNEGPTTSEGSDHSQESEQKGTRAIVLAQEEARRLGHNFVGTEQLLLGLIGAGGKLTEVFQDFGLDLDSTRSEVERIIGRGSGFVAVEIPFTPRAKRVLENSWDEARQLGHNFIGREHLLLGLLRESEGVASEIFKQKKIDTAKLREAVIELFDDQGETGSGVLV